MKKRNILTNNKEIYNKFNMLNFSEEILLKDVKFPQIKKILCTINKNEKILDSEIIGKYILIKKKKPINFNIYKSK